MKQSIRENGFKLSFSNFYTLVNISYVQYSSVKRQKK